MSFFVDDAVLDLSGIAIERDIYLAYWIWSLKPVVNYGVYGEFLKVNDWIHGYFDDGAKFDGSEKRLITRWSFWRWIFERILNGWFGHLLEKQLKRWQVKRAKDKACTAGGKANLIVGDHMLKFHNIDRRRQYRNRWFLKYGEGAKLTRERFLRMRSI